MSQTSARHTAETRARILDTAEALFVEHGLDGTSMRMITGRAGVNLAAVNYHFGSKENLIREVFEQRVQALNRRCIDALDRYADEARQSGRALRPGDLLEAFLQPVFELAADTENGGYRFMRLLGRTHSEVSPFMRRLLAELYGDTLQRFLDVLCGSLPGVPREEVHWRVHFMMGATSYAIAGTDNLQVFGGQLDQQDPAELVPRLLSFLLAGLRAPLPERTEPPDPPVGDAG
ncbi:MAG: TetR/AcrR family transcriptional regulator [Thioalkalivibrio sp.]|nr:MAG: TetR/AcrR family transcriptional regulator [Thioalkalivibrio sp.]